MLYASHAEEIWTPGEFAVMPPPFVHSKPQGWATPHLVVVLWSHLCDEVGVHCHDLRQQLRVTKPACEILGGGGEEGGMCWRPGHYCSTSTPGSASGVRRL